MEQTIILLFALIFVGIITSRYKNGAFIRWHPEKPKIVFFPKYEIDLGLYNIDIKDKLRSNGFVPSTENPNLWKRGNLLGDFSINKILLHAEILNGGNTLRIYCPNFIFFDTGDTWGLINELLCK